MASDSYDAYVAGLLAQNPTSPTNVTADMRAKIGGPDGLRQVQHGQLKLDRSVPASAPLIA